MALAFEKYDAEHQRLWDSMKIIRDQTTLNRVAEKVKANRSVYEAVQKATGVPWQLVAVIHLREAGEQDIGRFLKQIHNGQSWKIKSTIVPKGVGPFTSWHEAAVHALKMKKFHTVVGWTPAKMVSAAEPYNGYGYRQKGMRSPYLWASTNHQQRGKYVADHVFDSTVMDSQVGVAAQLKFLGVGESPAGKATGAGIVVVSGAGAAAAVAATPPNYLPWVIGGLIILGVLGLVIYVGSTNTDTIEGTTENPIPLAPEVEAKKEAQDVKKD